MRAALLLALSTAALAVSQPVSAQAPAGAYEMDRTHASLTWKILHMGLSNYTARFTTFDADLFFNEADVTKSRINVKIDPRTVETDYARQRAAGDTKDFNKEVSDDARFFNAVKFPSITFVSKAVSKTGPKTGRLTGDLTMLGVTRPVTLDVVYVGDRRDPRLGKHKVGFSARGKVRRSEFGMTFGSAFLGDEVEVIIEAEFVQK